MVLVLYLNWTDKVIGRYWRVLSQDGYTFQVNCAFPYGFLARLILLTTYASCIFLYCVFKECVHTHTHEYVYQYALRVTWLNSVRPKDKWMFDYMCIFVFRYGLIRAQFMLPNPIYLYVLVQVYSVVISYTVRLCNGGRNSSSGGRKPSSFPETLGNVWVLLIPFGLVVCPALNQSPWPEEWDWLIF